MSQTTDTNSPEGYAELTRRAYLFLEKHEGRASEAALIQGVFGVRGTTKSLELWSGILGKVLNDPERFQHLPGGEWVLRSHTDTTQPLQRLEYVVIDTETTGLHPHRCRMIEVAAVKLRNGQQVDTFQSLINPQRRIPGFITTLTGINNQMTASAPTFAGVANNFMEFLGNAIVVGHNVLFDLRFLNYELGLLHRPALVNEAIDTISLSLRLFPGIRRPNLDRLAEMTGVNIKNRHRAFGDATTTAEAFMKLLEIAALNGFETLDDLRTGRVRQAEISMPETPPKKEVPSLFESEMLEERPDRIKVTRPHWKQPYEDASSLTNRATAHARDVLSRELIRDLPDKPGVYLMKDLDDGVIYVGKAKNLYARVSSYYSEPLGYTRKMDGLVEAIKRIDHIVTGSELEALLLESRLIKKYKPRYNSQLRNYESYPFIKIDLSQRFPRVQSCREILDDGARYFGPFQSRRAVDTTIRVIEQMFTVRDCTRNFETEYLAKRRQPRPACMRLYTNRCPGPCVGNHSDHEHEEYLKVIDEVVNFLSGEKEAVLDVIWKRINRAVAERDFEKAAAMRDALAQTQQVIASQKYLARAVEGNHALLCLPSSTENCLEILCIFSGRLGKQLKLSRTDSPQQTAAKLQQTWLDLEEWEARLAASQPGWGKKGGRVIGQEAVDEINIISRWIYQHSDDPGIISIPRDNTHNSTFWQEISTRIYNSFK
ncbi:MAG: GIY-YIG nuclease family protein [Chloroflexi bacterium]|uniref:GIY-YIG nuclease family protein n=1 Tax=Candidatus Chlorohelix allophototropha TaxID=3003348 RepID=A0A8T7M741_9CHLR|nr:GIY-YIG nuclease family protein [Chloroflexota bacterium]WJW69667.1 GIY-YIG nuclease family protein [Chloroflexota bacterium L227-S17]